MAWQHALTPWPWLVVEFLPSPFTLQIAFTFHISHGLGTSILIPIPCWSRHGRLKRGWDGMGGIMGEDKRKMGEKRNGTGGARPEL